MTPPTVTLHAVARYRQRIDPTASERQARRIISAAFATPIATESAGRVLIVTGQSAQKRQFIALACVPDGWTRRAVMSVDRAGNQQTYGRVQVSRAYRLKHRVTLPEEAEFITGHLPTHPIEWIARRLGRSPKSIVSWCWRHHQAPTKQWLVTSGQAAEITGVSQQAITARIRAGTLPARRLPGGRWWLLEIDDLPRRPEFRVFAGSGTDRNRPAVRGGITRVATGRVAPEGTRRN